MMVSMSYYTTDKNEKRGYGAKIYFHTQDLCLGTNLRCTKNNVRMEIKMRKGYSSREMGRIALGTHLGDFSKEDSEKQIQAMIHALKNGIYTLDGAINYRGMCSEKDEGIAINTLIHSGKFNRADIFITSKAGLLFGDIRAGMNPKKYLSEILEPNGISQDDFIEYEGLYQTLEPQFYEIALNKSLENLNLETLDVHYIHIPEISRRKLSLDEFYDKMEVLLRWYEEKVKEGKIRNYGLALEFMVEEPNEVKWNFEMEEIKRRADKIANGKSHFRYVLFDYNVLCDSGRTVKNQTVDGMQVSLIDACHKLELETVASMPFAMGDGFENHTLSEMLEFALNSMDHVIVGSKNPKHIDEIIAEYMRINQFCGR